MSLQSLSATGKPPPTATRLATGAKTGLRTGTKGGAITDMKDALTETLVKKMREKFAAKDMAVQDIIGEEVVAFMSTTGSVKEDDIASLEGRIRDRVMGKANAGRRYKGPVVDEWADITKWQAEESAREEKMKRETIKARQVQMRAELDEQVKERAARVEDEKVREMKYNEEEVAALEVWKKEEQSKLEKKTMAMQKLKAERDAQLTDQARRKQDYLAMKEREEGEAKKLLALEHRRKLQEEVNSRQKMKDEMALLAEMNKQSLDMHEVQMAKERAEDLKFQREYAEKLEQQEKARLSNLAKMKEKQKLQEMAGESRGPTKRYMDEKIIERNFQEREAALDLAEEEAVKKVTASNLEMRRIIAEQVKEKRERIAREKASEASRYNKFSKVLNSLDAMEKAAADEEHQKMLRHKAELEAQMRDNQIRKQVFPMTNVERSLNSDLLKKVKN